MVAVKTRVSKEARDYVRMALKQYQSNKLSRKLMEEKLRIPYQEIDDNIGGGRSNRISKPVEEEFDRVWTNDDFLTMVDELNAIDRVLKNIKDESALRVIEERYFNLEVIREGQRRMQSWVKVASIIPGMTEDTCRNIERTIVDKIAKEMRLR